MPSSSASRIACVDDRVRVAEQACGVLAEKVDVLVPVGVGQARALAAHDRERERLDVDDRARVPAGHHLRALFVQAARLGISLDVAALRRGDERFEIGDRGLGHGLHATPSDVEAGVLEIEVALDEVHHVVVDPSLAPELDDRSPLGVEELAAQSLVVLRPLLDARRRPPSSNRAEKRLRRKRYRPRIRSAVSSRTQSSPASSSRRATRRVGGVDPRLRLLLAGTPVVLQMEQADHQRQAQPLQDERGEDDAEREVDQQVTLRKRSARARGERQRERRRQRHGAAQARPADERRVLPRRVRVALANLRKRNRGT